MATPRAFGVTAQGFVRMTEADLVAAFEADQKADIGDDFDTAPDQLAGQINGIVGRQLGIAWEAVEGCYNAYDPDAAEGRSLENVSKITGTRRRGSTRSEVKQSVTLDAGTVLLADEHYAAIEDRPDVRWTPKADFTAPSDGAHVITFVSEQYGPIEGFAGTINVIATPVVGWHTTVNPEDAELGKEIDTDTELRLRRERELATSGSATVPSIAANVAQAFPEELLSLNVFENDKDETDENGLPPHTLEVLIFDGETPSIDDDALAQVIFDSKAGGAGTYGNEHGIAKGTLPDGTVTDFEVRFTRAEVLRLWLEIDVTPKAGYVGDAEVAKHVASQANAKFGPGEDVIVQFLRSFPLALQGVKDVRAVRIGLAANPVATENFPISLRQIARFSTDRIKVNS